VHQRKTFVHATHAIPIQPARQLHLLVFPIRPVQLLLQQKEITRRRRSRRKADPRKEEKVEEED